MRSINALSDEILVQIFRYLDLQDLIAVRRVNAKLRKAAENGRLYQRVHFHRRHRLDDVLSVIRRQKNVIETCIMEKITDSNTVLERLRDCPNLRRLRLNECDGERGIREDVFRHLFSKTKINDLALKNCELERFPQLRNLKNVTSLVITDNNGYRYPLHYGELFSAIKNNVHTLLCLRLSIQNITSPERDQLFTLAESCDKLKIFHFQYPRPYEITETNLKRLLKLNNLVSVSLVVSPKVSLKARREFVDRLCALHNLRKLEIGGEICNSLIQLSVLRTFTKLEILRLTSPSLTKAPFLSIDDKDLLNLLAPCKQLTEIVLKTIYVNNARRAILQLPTRLPKLHHVEIEVKNKVDESSDDTSLTPLKIEFSLLPNYALETRVFDRKTTVYTLFKSEQLLKFLTSSLEY